jgi:type II secretory pathway component PulF
VPLGHRKLAAWYEQLAQHLDAGVPLPIALRASQGAGAPAAALEQMARKLESGASIEAVLNSAGRWLPATDALALSAAAGAGRMPQTLRNLAVRHTQIGTTQLKMALACAYPIGVLHFALLLLPVVRMIDWERGFHWSTPLFVQTLAVTVVPLWLAGLVLFVLARRGNPVVHGTLQVLPALRGYVRAQALADFSFILGSLLDAGVPIGRAWATAGQLSRSAALRTAARKIEARIARGERPSAHLAASPCFPPDFIALYRTGEATGKLDANLLRLAAQNQDAANRSLSLATLIYPGILFILVAIGVAYFVISIYAGYLEMLGKIAE